ncbi:N-formylmaleamate deformylase [Nitrobacteraceae bacterium AZCC 1564]
MSQTNASGFLYGANVRANGIRQHYLRFGGKGPALVIVPGITTVAAQWAFVAERLCRTFDTYVVDVRGRGLSECGPHLDYSVDACAADIIHLAGAIGLKKFSFLGHSMGARIGIRAARHHPGVFDQLVLVDPPVSGPGRREYPIPLAPLLALVSAAKRGEGEAALRAPSAPRWPEPHIRVRAEWLHTCDERAVAESYHSFHNDDIHSDLSLLKMPTALVVAGKGGVILAADEAEIRQLLPSIVIKRLEGAGHQMQIDDPEGFFAVLASLFNSQFQRSQGCSSIN